MLIEQKQKIKIKINPADFMADIKRERASGICPIFDFNGFHSVN